MQGRLWTVWLLMGVVVWWSGCSAPHDNPLDPASKHYTAPADPEPELAARVRSVHISRNSFPDTYSVIAELYGNDVSQQDSAWVAYDGQAEVSLSQTAPDVMATIFASSYFHDSRLSSVVGMPFLFRSRDNSGRIHETGPAFMWRVIDSVAVLDAPKGTLASHDTVDSHPKFSWLSYTAAAYPVGFRATVIDLSVGDGVPKWVSPLQPRPTTQVHYPDSLTLPDGDYYWTLTVIDSFQNTSRSKEGYFTVKG